MEYNGYCVRINAHEGYGDKIRMLPANTDYEAIAGVLHKGAKGENPHYHLVIKTQVRDQALRVRLRKIFAEGKGNSHMSIKAWDGNIDAISYLFHENPEGQLFLNYNIPEETVQKARARNIEVQDKMEKAKERASYKIEEELLQIYRQRQATAERRDQQIVLSEMDIAKDIILHALRRDKYIPNDFLLKSMARKIQFKLLNGDDNDEELFAKRLISTVYRLDYDQHQQWMSWKGIYTDPLRNM